MGPEILFFVFYPELVPDIPSVRIDRFNRQIKEGGNLLCGSALPYKV